MEAGSILKKPKKQQSVLPNDSAKQRSLRRNRKHSFVGRKRLLSRNDSSTSLVSVGSFSNLNAASFLSISTPQKSKRKSVLGELGNFLHKKQHSRAKPNEKKHVHFDKVVVELDSKIKCHLQDPWKWDPIELDLEEFDETPFDDLEYELDELVSHSVYTLNCELFRTLVKNYSDDICLCVSQRKLEALLTRVMIGDDVDFARTILKFAKDNQDVYVGFKILSHTFFHKRTTDFQQPMFITLVQQGNLEMIKLALDSGFGDAAKLRRIYVGNGDNLISEWKKYEVTNDNEKRTSKKKNKKRGRKKQETKKDKRLDKVQKLDIKELVYEKETVLTAVLKQDNMELMQFFLDYGLAPEDHDYIAYRLAARYAMVDYILLFLERLHTAEADPDMFSLKYHEILKIVCIESSSEQRRDMVQWTLIQIENNLGNCQADIGKVADSAIQSMYTQGEALGCVLRYRILHGIILLLELKAQLVQISEAYVSIGTVTPRVLYAWFVNLLQRGEYCGNEVMRTLFSLGLAPYLADPACKKRYIQPSKVYMKPHSKGNAYKLARKAPVSPSSQKRPSIMNLPAIPSMLKGGNQPKKANFQQKEIAIGFAAKHNELEMLKILLSLVVPPDNYWNELLILAAKNNAEAVTRYMITEASKHPIKPEELRISGKSLFPKRASLSGKRSSLSYKRSKQTRSSQSSHLITQHLSLKSSSKETYTGNDSEEEVFTPLGSSERLTVEEALEKAFSEALRLESIDTARVLIDNNVNKIHKAATYIGEILVQAVTTQTKLSERFLTELLQLLRDYCDSTEKELISKLLSLKANESKSRNVVNLNIIFDGYVPSDELKDEILPEHFMKAIESSRRFSIKKRGQTEKSSVKRKQASNKPKKLKNGQKVKKKGRAKRFSEERS